MSYDVPCHNKAIELQYDRAIRTIPTVNLTEKYSDTSANEDNSFWNHIR